MSTSAKVILGIVIVVIIAGGIWVWKSSAPSATNTAANTNQPAANTPSANNASSGSQTQTGVSASDNSNAALQASLSNVDSKMSGFSSDNASVNQGMNDQPVQQSSL